MLSFSNGAFQVRKQDHFVEELGDGTVRWVSNFDPSYFHYLNLFYTFLYFTRCGNSLVFGPTSCPSVLVV